MKTMDRRIAERRHRVTEERARTRLRLVIGLVALVALAAAGFACTSDTATPPRR